MKLNPEIKLLGQKYKAEIKGIENAIRKFDRIAIFRHISTFFNGFLKQRHHDVL